MRRRTARRTARRRRRRAALAELDDRAVVVDYLQIRTSDLAEVDEGASGRTEARVLVAARVGGTRLIDNLPLTLGIAPGPSNDETER